MKGSGWALTLLVAVRFGIATRQEGPTKHEDKRLKAKLLEEVAASWHVLDLGCLPLPLCEPRLCPG